MTLYVNGVNLLPSTGEFTYDTIPYQGKHLMNYSSRSRYLFQRRAAGKHADRF